MSKIAVLPSYKFAPNTNAIKAGLRAAMIHGLESIAVLGDGKEREKVDTRVSDWVEAQKNTGLVVEAVTTKWLTAPQTAVRDRNEALLDNADAVIVLGPVCTQSAARTLDYAFGRPGVKVVQIDFDGKAEIVGSETIMVSDARYKPTAKEVKVAAPGGWDEFTSAPVKKEGRSAKK